MFLLLDRCGSLAAVDCHKAQNFPDVGGGIHKFAKITFDKRFLVASRHSNTLVRMV